MNTTKKPRKPGSGGARPGAGRKPMPLHEKAQQVSLSLTPAELADYYELKRRSDIDVNRFIGKALRRKITALNRADRSKE